MTGVGRYKIAARILPYLPDLPRLGSQVRSQSEFRVTAGGRRSGVPSATLTHLLPSGNMMPGEPNVSHLPSSVPTRPSVLGEKSMVMVSPSSDTLPSSFHTSESSG